MTLPAWAPVVILGAFFAGVIPVDIVLVRRAARRIQECHPDTWAQLGIRSPHSFAFQSFVRNKEYLTLDDPELTALFERKRRFDWITGLAFVATTFGYLAWERGLFR